MGAPTQQQSFMFSVWMRCIGKTYWKMESLNTRKKAIGIPSWHAGSVPTCACSVTMRLYSHKINVTDVATHVYQAKCLPESAKCKLQYGGVLLPRSHGCGSKSREFAWTTLLADSQISLWNAVCVYSVKCRSRETWQHATLCFALRENSVKWKKNSKKNAQYSRRNRSACLC